MASADTGRNTSLKYDRRARWDRLNKNAMKLYHATNKSAALAIEKSGKFLRGNGGSCGSGIYFAQSPSAASMFSARGSDVILECKVHVGDSFTGSADGITFTKLINQKKDSVYNARGFYVVYNYDQIDMTTLRRVQG